MIILFFIAIVAAFGMLAFRAWEMRTGRVRIPEYQENRTSDLSFRQVEKNMLYLAKHMIQGIVLAIAKYWFIMTTRTKKWLSGKWPKIHERFVRKTNVASKTQAPSFIKRAILESKAKIKRVKEKVKREHSDEDRKDAPSI
jgi:hypothetical protein